MFNMRPIVITMAFLAPGLAFSADTEKAQEYKAMPWHLIDIWWNLGEDTPFESYSLDFHVSDDVSPDVNLYIAPLGVGKLNKTQFYGGIQTQADGNTRNDPTHRKIGPGFLMSMWGERSPEAIRPADGGFYQSAGHEGDFVSVRRPYAWKKGSYTYRITRMDKEIIDGKPYTWVGAFVHVLETNENLFIGALRFPGEQLVLAKQIASFIEVYGMRRPVSDIPKLTVTFSNPTVNGRSINAATARAIYPEGVPDYAEAIVKDRKLVITVGNPVTNRTSRTVELIGKQ